MSISASLDNFLAVSEFFHHTDTCGETAFLVLEHCKDGIPLNGPDVDAVRDDMQAKGYDVVGGTNMAELCDYFAKHRGLSVDEVCHYGSSPSQIHSALLAHAGRRGVVLQVIAAYNLTGNESGVHSHFVALGAIHPELGYLIANGDDEEATAEDGGHGKIIPTRWIPWSVIESARPMAVAVVSGLSYTEVGSTLAPIPAGGLTPIPAPSPVPTQPEPTPAPVAPVLSGTVMSELGAVATALSGLETQVATIRAQMQAVLNR